MKVRVEDLEANPFREIGKYPIDRKKVEGLKNSIKEKGFFASLPVRKHGDKYQIAAGHHRWFALKELNEEDIEVTVHDYSDAMMIKVMAEENFNWESSPAVLTQTLVQVKKYINAEIAKYKTWEEFSSGQLSISNPLLIESEPAFRKLKGSKGGVGRNTLVTFLGHNWTNRKVRAALDIVNDDTLDKKAIELIPTVEQAIVFKQGVKKYSMPKPVQRKIAEKIVKEGIGKRDIPKEIVKHSAILPMPKEDEGTKVQGLIEDIDIMARSLKNKIMILRKEMELLQIEEIRGVKAWLAKCSLNQLEKEIKRIKEYENEAN